MRVGRSTQLRKLWKWLGCGSRLWPRGQASSRVMGEVLSWASGYPRHVLGSPDDPRAALHSQLSLIPSAALPSPTQQSLTISVNSSECRLSLEAPFLNFCLRDLGGGPASHEKAPAQSAKTSLTYFSSWQAGKGGTTVSVPHVPALNWGCPLPWQQGQCLPIFLVLS